MLLGAATFDWPSALSGGAVAALGIIVALTLTDLIFYLRARQRWQATSDPASEVDPRFLGFIGKGTPKPPSR
jgi:hypothetical protein